MKYVVEVCYGDRNEWSNEFDYWGDAYDYACMMSKLAEVSECRVYTGDEVTETLINGEEVFDRDEFDEWAEYDEPHYPFDEVGYDPYTGGIDPDL